MSRNELMLDWNKPGTPAQTVYHLRLSDPHDELLEAATLAAVMDSVVDDGGEFEAVFDALIVNAAKIETKAKQLGMAFARAAQSVTLVDNGVTVSQPFKQNGSTQIAMLFEMSDGQTITVYLHNPDVKPNQLQGDDVLVSWKWLLNRKDITIVVAKENGKDLALAQVATRIMALVDKNSARFSKANANRQARLNLIADLETQVSVKEATLKDLVAQLETKRSQPTPVTPTQQVGDATLQFTDFEGLRAFLDGQAVDEHATPLSKASIVFQNGMSYALINRSAWESGQDDTMVYELTNKPATATGHTNPPDGATPSKHTHSPETQTPLMAAVEAVAQVMVSQYGWRQHATYRDDNRVYEKFYRGADIESPNNPHGDLRLEAQFVGSSMGYLSMDNPLSSVDMNVNEVVNGREAADFVAEFERKVAEVVDMNRKDKGMPELGSQVTPKTVDMDEAVQTLNNEVLAGDAKAVMLVLRDDDSETVQATRLVRGGKSSEVNKAKADLLAMASGSEQKYFMVHHIYPTDYAYTAREKLQLLGYTVTERFNIDEHIPDDVKSFLQVGQLYDLARNDGSGFYEGLRFMSYQVNYKYTERMEVVAVFQASSTHFEENVTRLSQKIVAKQLVVSGSAPVAPAVPETTLPDEPVIAPIIAPDSTPAADNPIAVFLQSVIDGQVDMTAADFAQTLTAMHEQTVGDESLTQLFNQAVEVYAAMAMAQAKQALGSA